MENAPVDTKNYLGLVKSSSILVIMNAFLSVDTFFYLSAFLVAYMMFLDPKSAQKFSYAKYVLFRYLRLTPAAMMLMFTWWILYPVVGAGNQYGGSPMWYRKPDHNSDACPKYWWTHLLYISNLYPGVIRDECDAPYWYLSADFQLYLIAPLFILPLMSTRKLIRQLSLASFFVVGVLGHIAWTVVPSILNHTSALPTPVSTTTTDVTQLQRDLDNWHQHFYQLGWNHVNTMLIGILSAWICVRIRS